MIRRDATLRAHAIRYIAEGRVRITAVSPTAVVATVIGANGLRYRPEWSAEAGLTCNCHAAGVCVHAEAVRLVVDVDGKWS